MIPGIQGIQDLAVDLTIYILWLKNFSSINTVILISVYYYHILNTNLEMSQPWSLLYPLVAKVAIFSQNFTAKVPK